MLITSRNRSCWRRTIGGTVLHHGSSSRGGRERSWRDGDGRSLLRLLLAFLLEVSDLLLEVVGDSCQGAIDNVVDKADWERATTVIVSVTVAVVVIVSMSGLAAAAVVHCQF